MLLVCPPKHALLPVIEFYSGIGGMRAALQECQHGAAWEVVMAIDVNEKANKVYKHAWRKTTTSNSGNDLKCKGIEHLTAADLNGLAKLWTMSPPCQPFCSQGLRRDAEDTRSRSFLHLMHLLPTLEAPPEHLLLENVPYFEGSQCHAVAMEALKQGGFTHVCEATLSPRDLGLPNTRSRYFLLASRTNSALPRRFLPPTPQPRVRPLAAFLLTPGEVAAADAVAAAAASNNEDSTHATTTNGEVEAPGPQSVLAGLQVSQSTLEKFNYVSFDVCTPGSTETLTVTKGYGKQVGKSGPLLDMDAWEAWPWSDDAKSDSYSGTPGSSNGDGSRTTSSGSSSSRTEEEEESSAENGVLDSSTTSSTTGRFRQVASHERMRLLAPRELLRLHGFPESFQFPPDLTAREAQALIGNSVAVPVVASLLDLLLAPSTFLEEEPPAV